jgi:hypothetical protein
LEKPAEKKAAVGNTSTESTATTTPSTANTDTSGAGKPLSKEDRMEQSRRLLNTLKLKPISKQSSGMSRPSSGASQPSSGREGGESELLDPIFKGLTMDMQQIAQKPTEKLPERDPVASETETQQTPSPGLPKTTASPILREPERKPKLSIKTVPMKLGPKLGRQILVQNDKGVDCATAIRTLEVTCRANYLRQQEASQRFHVRRGQARKNLRIKRWRKLFKFSFLETVKKINRMRDQGW